MNKNLKVNMKNHIQYFPTNVLVKIFSYVNDEDMCNSIPFVCEKWKIASSHSLLLENASFEGKLTSPKDICYVLHNTPLLKSVSLVSVDDVVPVLRQICRSNKQIEKIALKNCTCKGSIVPQDVLINVLLSLSNLRSIELNQTKFESHIFFEILARQSNVTSIDISKNEFVTLNDLMLLVHNSKIKEFKMSRRYTRPQISDQEMSHLIKTMKHDLVLLHLDMSGLGNYTYNEILCCSKLSDLKLNSAMNLSAELLTKVPRSLRKIQHLKIEGPSLLTKGDFEKSLFIDLNFARQLDSLKLDNFDSLSDNECCTILDACSNLKALSLKGCKSLTIEGICDPLVKIPHLMYLNVAFISKLTGIHNVVHVQQLKTLVVDEIAYQLNNLSTSLINEQLRIIVVTRNLIMTHLLLRDKNI